MRSLLGGWSPAVVSICVAVELLACPRVASPQAKDSTTGPAPVARQASLATRQSLTTSNGEVSLDRRASDRLQSAQHVLFDGRYADAMTAFATVLESGDAR